MRVHAGPKGGAGESMMVSFWALLMGTYAGRQMFRLKPPF
jgi:hypothetical protein